MNPICAEPGAVGQPGRLYTRQSFAWEFLGDAARQYGNRVGRVLGFRLGSLHSVGHDLCGNRCLLRKPWTQPEPVDQDECKRYHNQTNCKHIQTLGSELGN